MKSLLSGCILVSLGFLWNCGKKQVAEPDFAFTKADSLTDIYLALQDNILQSWNMMINDDNQKIKAVHNLLHELMVSNPDERETFADFEERLDMLMRTRYTQKSMINADVVREYDFASASLIKELIYFAQSKREFSYNATLQRLVNDIRIAEDRAQTYRVDYDSVVLVFNRFIEKNREPLSEFDHSLVLEKKPLFRVVSEE